MGAILQGLKNGSRFSFDLLAQEYDEVSAFWDWWWERNSGTQKLTRPYTIIDNDSILRRTIEKETVDTISFNETFYPFLNIRVDKGDLPIGRSIPRSEFRSAIARHLASRAEAAEKQQVVFVGGGYGAGKTTTLSMLAKHEQVSFNKTSLLGVDYCKLLIPEFDRIKAVYDGRASEVCQEEARLISDELFHCAISQGRSFAWDSSMSNFDQTMKKITAAKTAGYELWMIGVWTPPEIAIRRAMGRARETKRFAHPNHLIPSAKGFSKNFEHYFPYFDTVQLYENAGDADNQESAEPRLIAWKDPVDLRLAIADQFKTEEFLQFGQIP